MLINEWIEKQVSLLTDEDWNYEAPGKTYFMLNIIKQDDIA